MAFDLLIKNAAIYDGLGARLEGDLGVIGDRISAVGDLPAQAAFCIDAGGRAVAPGFIDIHSHADLAVLEAPRHECKVLQGVTTEVFSNCGLGFAPLGGSFAEEHRRELAPLFGTAPSGMPSWQTTAEYLDLLEPSVNVAYLVAHGAVRARIKGYAETPASSDEIRRMCDWVREARDAGALGLSTGLYYRPMTAASVDETAALAQAAGGLFAIHLRDMGPGLFSSLDEAVQIAERAGVRLQISHLQAIRENRGKAARILERLELSRARGQDVAGDVYPYAAGSTMLSALKPEEFDSVPWDAAFLVEDGSLIGEKERALELEGAFVVHDRDEAEVELFVGWEHATIGSDGLHVGARPHPRLWGTFPRVLARWGFDALPKMTSRSADRLGLTDRGVIRKGAAADLVVLSEPRDRATFIEPTLPPAGVDWVIVNGVVVVAEGVHTGARPGRVLRK